MAAEGRTVLGTIDAAITQSPDAQHCIVIMYSGDKGAAIHTSCADEIINRGMMSWAARKLAEMCRAAESE